MNFIEENKNSLLIIAVIIGILALTSPAEDKKEGMFSGGFLAGGIGTIFFGVLAIVGGIIGGIPLAIFGGAIMSILGLFGTGVGLQGIFSPSPTMIITSFN